MCIFTYHIYNRPSRLYSLKCRLHGGFDSGTIESDVRSVDAAADLQSLLGDIVFGRVEDVVGAEVFRKFLSLLCDLYAAGTESVAVLGPYVLLMLADNVGCMRDHSHDRVRSSGEQDLHHRETDWTSSVNDTFRLLQLGNGTHVHSMPCHRQRLYQCALL